MPKAKSKSPSEPIKDIRTPISPENAEAQCISFAMDLVRQRLIDGTASSQEVTHFLKLGSRRAQVELEKLEREKDLAIAKTKKIESEESMERMYADAIKAFRGYSGQGESYDDEWDD